MKPIRLGVATALLCSACGLTLHAQSLPDYSVTPELQGASASLPSRAKRVYAIERAGLAEDTSALDELDQDLLFVNAQHKSLAQLQNTYPTLPAAKLQRLQSLVHGGLKEAQ